MGSYILYVKVSTAIIFIIFAIMNLNDPDWFIWIPAYGIIASLILVTNNKIRKIKLFTGCFFQYLDYLFLQKYSMMLCLLSPMTEW